MAITVEMRAQVSQLYVALFGRAPDGEGLGYWVNLMSAGQTVAQVADTMYATAPARAFYPTFLTNQEIVANFYVNVLGRTADAEGLAYWTAKLNAAGATPGKVIAEMINVVANYAGSDPAGLKSQALFNNKANIAQWYGEKNGSVQGATSILSTITEDPATVVAAKAAADSSVETFTLTTGIDRATANTFFASQTRYDVDGKGPTLNPGDELTGMAGRTDNKLLITDLTPDVAQNNLPAAVKLNNIQVVELDSAANIALGGLRTRDFTSVNTLKGTTQGAGATDLYIAGNANFGTSTKVTVSQLSFAAAAGVRVDGGHDVTVSANGGAGVRVGNQNLASVPTAQQVATGAVDVTVNNTAGGGINVFGGTTVKATVNSTSNTGAISIGNTGANTGNTLAGAIANATGDVTVATAGRGAVTVFGGDNVVVSSTAPGGAGGAVGAITVGDVAYRTASNLAKGNVTITETNAIAYNGLAGSGNNDVVNGAISVFGGKNVSITTNGANAINVGQVGNGAKENALNPTGTVTIANTGVETAAAAGAIQVTGGTDVTVTSTGSNITIGRAVNAVTDQVSNPSGNVTVTQTMNGAGFGRAVVIDGGKDITVNAKGQNVTIGDSVASAPTGAVVVNQADLFTGNTNAVLNGTNPGNVIVRGGTDVTVNTSGGNVTVGGVVGGVNAVPSGAVKITNTFGGVGADTVAVQGGTKVDITTTKTSGTITVGADSAALNAAGTALKDANLAPTGDITIVNQTTSGALKAYGTGAVNVRSNGATTVSVTGGNVDNIVDIQSTLATGGANSGKAVGTSTLKTVVIDRLQVADGVAIKSDALTELTLTNVGAANTVTVTNNTAAHALTITQGGNVSGSTVADANAGSVTIKDNGVLSTGTLRVDAAKAIAVTIDNAASAAINLGGVSSDIATVTLKGAGAVNLASSGKFGVGNLAKAKTIDASAATGNVTAALQMTTTADEVQAYKGGSGIDTVTVNSNASAWSNKATIDGGNGSSDVLVLDYAAAGTDVAMGNAANVKGFEVLGLGASANSAGGAYDASGFSTVQLGGVAGNVTFSNTATGLTLNVQANTTDKTVTVTGANYSATNTAMTVNLGSTPNAFANTNILAAGGGTGTGIITAHAVENLTVNSVGKSLLGVGNTATINGTPTNGAATLTIGGAASLTLTSNSGFTSINASGNTGTTVDVTAAKVSNSGVTFTGGASKLVAAGSNDSANIKALVVVSGTGNALAADNQATLNIDGTTLVFQVAAGQTVTAAQAATALANAVNAQLGNGGTQNLVVNGVTLGTTTQTGANVLSTTAATVSGGNIVLQHNSAFEVRTLLAQNGGAAIPATTTIADSLLGGQQVNQIAVAVTGANVENEVVRISINGTDYTVTLKDAPGGAALLAGTEVATGSTAAQIATALETQIKNANPAGISSVVRDGANLLITSQLGQTNLVTVAETLSNGTIGDTTSINMTTVNNEFITGTGGGDYKAGLGGSFSTVTKKFGSGSETVNLTASTAKVDTLTLKEGAVVTDNATKGGVTGFTVGSQTASDTVVFRNAADNAGQAKTIVANAVTGVVNTLNNAANMAAVFDSTGALNTKLANLTYTISNGVITFGATGGNSLSQFTVNELINAAQMIVSSTTTGGANQVAAFSHNGRSYVVASDNANTLAGSGGAGSNTNNIVVELKDVASVKGFGATFGDATIVSSTVTNRTNAAIDLAALATNSDLNYTGFAIATLDNLTAAPTASTKFNNLAASAELKITGASAGSMGFLETTQVGASGKNSLTVTMETAAKTIERLTTNGDALVVFAAKDAKQTVKELVDATGTMNTVQVTGNNELELQKITGTALTTVNAALAGGKFTFASLAAPDAHNNLMVFLSAGQASDVWTSGSGNAITQTAGGAGTVNLVASGSSNTITVANGNNNITANGAGNTITVGTGTNTVVATGADTKVVIGGNANVTTVTVGTNATVTMGTNDIVKVTGAVTGGTADNFAKTTLAFAALTVPAGNQIDFSGTAPAFSLLGAAAASSQVNVASATSLTQALNMAANYTLLVQDQGTAADAAANLLAANTGKITWFQYGGDTYVVAMVNDTAAAVQQTALDANDIVVKLTGLVDLTGSGFAGEVLTL